MDFLLNSIPFAPHTRRVLSLRILLLPFLLFFLSSVLRRLPFVSSGISNTQSINDGPDGMILCPPSAGRSSLRNVMLSQRLPIHAKRQVWKRLLYPDVN